MKLEHYQFLKDLISLVKGFGLYPKGSGSAECFGQKSDISTVVFVNDGFTCNVRNDLGERARLLVRKSVQEDSKHLKREPWY